MLGAVNAGQIIVPLVAALIAAFGAMAVGWKRLKILGTAERGKLEAEKASIVQAAADRAAKTALDVLQRALDVTERSLKVERDAREVLQQTIRDNAETIRELGGRVRDLEQANVKAQETAYQSLLQTIPDAVIQAGPDGRVRNANQAASDLFGYPNGDLVGLPLSALMPDRYRAKHRTGFAAAVKTGTGPLIDSSDVTRLWALKSDGSEVEICLRLGVKDGTFTAVIRPWLRERNGDGNGVPHVDPNHP